MPVRAPRKIGYTFFEAIVSAADARKAGDTFDVVATGSTWCASKLKEKGLDRVETVIQGIDPLSFNPSFAHKELFGDRFVVFSGGKFEFRKGQDVVIRAYKVLQDKHADVLLVNSWHNHWRSVETSMANSRLIQFRDHTGDHVSCTNAVLEDNGIDVRRVVTLPACSNESLARVYQNTDVGLFPNRCEGGTNLVLMEYMACGKPVIASFSSGHRDIVNDRNALLIKRLKRVLVKRGDVSIADWDDPDLDETVAQLEWAYDHRQEMRRLGEQAGKDLANFTWQRSAEAFAGLLAGSRHR